MISDGSKPESIRYSSICSSPMSVSRSRFMPKTASRLAGNIENSTESGILARSRKDFQFNFQQQDRHKSQQNCQQRITFLYLFVFEMMVVEKIGKVDKNSYMHVHRVAGSLCLRAQRA